MVMYILECWNCGIRVKYSTPTADGKKCKNCGGKLLLPIEDVEKYRKRYPRSEKIAF